MIKELTAHVWSQRRLILFFVYIRQKRKDEACKQDQMLQCQIHSTTSPLGKAKEICVPEAREATATVWCPPGIAAGCIISHTSELVKYKKLHTQFHKNY